MVLAGGGQDFSLVAVDQRGQIRGLTGTGGGEEIKRESQDETLDFIVMGNNTYWSTFEENGWRRLHAMLRRRKR